MIIYLGGTFSCLHAGHVNFFYRIKQLFPNSTLVVALNTDEFVEKYKGKKPVFNYDERCEQLLMCGYVDKVVENTFGEDSKPTILSVQPDIIAIGTDWCDKDYCGQMMFNGDWLAENDISLIYIPNKKIVSTTKIKSRFN